jgi:hypothetical protein
MEHFYGGFWVEKPAQKQKGCENTPVILHFDFHRASTLKLQASKASAASPGMPLSASFDPSTSTYAKASADNALRTYKNPSTTLGPFAIYTTAN